jgi:hypothetical protein
LIGLVLPGMVIACWLLLRGHWRRFVRLLWLPGLALFLLVAGPWFVLMQLRFPDFAHYFFVVQHFSRFAEGGFNNRQPFWFFPLVLLLLALPWSPWMLASLRRVDGPQADATPRALRQLLWLWVAMVTLFFSLPQSKLVGYILPVTAPLALLAADRFAAGARRSRAERLWRGSAVAAVAICVTLACLSGWLPKKSSRELAHVLADHMEPGDQVIFLHEYPFDFPFYARLKRPVVVVEDWSGSAAKRDNWRKELLDAGQFDQAAARSLLVAPAAWPSLVCAAQVSWVLGTEVDAVHYALLRRAELVAASGERALWRLSLSQNACGETPSVNSGNTS